MAKELRAGISISGDLVQTVVLEFHEDGIQVRHLNEFKCPDGGDTWVLPAVTEMRKHVSGKISNISMVLDYSSVFIHRFPLDTSLSKTEQNEHVHWELSHYLQDFRPQDYISDLRVVKSRARDQIAEVLTVNVKRDSLFRLQDKLTGMKIELQMADIPHFGAQHAFLAMYPEMRTKPVLLVGFSDTRIDAGVISNGRLTDYHYAIVSTQADRLSVIREVVASSAPTEIVAYGSAITAESLAELAASLERDILLLNPFRKLAIASSFHEFTNFTGREHHFAPIAGCVLRKE
jgi:hypothetical protein